MRTRASSHRAIRAAALVGLCLALVTGAREAADAKEQGGVPSPLRVGISPIYPPLAFKENGQLKGVEVDFANKLAETLGVKITLVELPWDGLIPALNSGKIDVIMSGMSITPERSKLVNFTQPYLEVGQMAIIRKADFEKFRTTEGLNTPGTRVGVLSNTTGERYARRALTSAQIVGFETVDAAVVALQDGKIDVFINDAPSIWRVTANFAKEHPDLMGRYQLLTNEELAWAVSKKKPELLDRLNQILITWKENGQVEQVLDHWITIRKVSVELTPLR